MHSTIAPATRIALAALLVFAFVGLAACAQPAAETQTEPAPEAVPAEPDGGTGAADEAALTGEQLVQERCTQCHSLEQAIAEDRDQAGWEAIVDDMIGRGAQLNPEERDLVVEYLTANYGTM